MEEEEKKPLAVFMHSMYNAMYSVGSLRISHILPLLLFSPTHMGEMLICCLTETTSFDLLISPDVRTAENLAQVTFF